MSNSVLEANLQYGQNRYEPHRNYWREVLSNGIHNIALPFPQKEKTAKSIGFTQKDKPSAEAAEYIKKIAKGSHMGMFILLLSVFKMLHYKCSQKESNVFSYLSPGLAGTLGVDYVILQSAIRDEELLKQTISDSAGTIAMAYRFQDYPLSLLDRRFSSTGFDITKFIDIGFSFVGLHNDYDKNHRPAVYFQFEDTGETGLEISLTTDISFIDNADAATLLKNYVSLLNRIAELLSRSITEIILPDHEQLAFMHQWFSADEPDASTVKDLFEAAASAHSEKTAVVFKNARLSYRELNSGANRTAKHMMTEGVTSQDRVIILMEMSICVPIAMLSAIKLGIPYIPLDVDLPSERIHYIIKDSGAKFIITDKSQKDFASRLSMKTFVIEDCKRNSEAANPQNKYNRDCPLYIIYTSGTTGTPKGIAVNHGNMVNYVNWFTKFANVTKQDKALLMSSFSFDLGYTSLYSSLLNGAELHLLNKDQYSNIPYMLEYMETQEVTFFKLTPPLFSLLQSDRHFTGYDLSCLRLVILGGIKRIGQVTEKLVPFMSFVYIAACLTVRVLVIVASPSPAVMVIVASGMGSSPVLGSA